ncbi:MAG: hypothetical protein WBV52_11335, partial [Pseudolabrys sp.]
LCVANFDLIDLLCRFSSAPLPVKGAGQPAEDADSGGGAMWLSDSAACANTTLSVEFRDNTRLRRESS